MTNEKVNFEDPNDEDNRPLCGGVPLPKEKPPGSSANGSWHCIDGQPKYIEDLGIDESNS